MNNNPNTQLPYTKGNWYLQEYTDAYTNIIRCNNGKHETLFIASTAQNTSPETRANARLMAAAPDLLEALQEIIAITDRDHIAWVKAKAAIEKAVGDGATSYATKLHQRDETIKILEYDNTRLKGELKGYKEAYEEVVKDRYRLSQENDEVMKNYNKLNEQATGWRPLLEDILEMDKQDIAYISEELIEKIKRFLYGND
jgi:hypothetical protein